MWHAVCEVCRQSQFDAAKVLAYEIRNKVPAPVALNGKDPWSGIRVICEPCCFFIEDFRLPYMR